MERIEPVEEAFKIHFFVCWQKIFHRLVPAFFVSNSAPVDSFSSCLHCSNNDDDAGDIGLHGDDDDDGDV